MQPFLPYPQYKNSGLPWVESIPEHWEIRKLKYAASFNPSRSESADLYYTGNEPVSFLPMKCITIYGALKNIESRKISEVWNGFTYFRRNDVVLAKITPCFENGKGGLLDKLPTEIGFGTTEFLVLRAIANKIYPAFLARILSLKIFRILGAQPMSGAAGQQRVSLEFVKNFRIALPPLPEQTQIAHYLHIQDAKIARLIKIKRELIKRLNEQKLRIIDQAITQGLNPSAPRKPSRVEWLGDVPEHWSVSRLGTCIKTNCSGVWGTDATEKNTSEHIVCIRVADFDIPHLAINSKKLTVRAIAENERIGRILQPGDILLEKSGGGKKISVGRVVEFTLNQASVCSNFIERIIPDTNLVCSKYLLILMNHLHERRIVIPCIKQTTGIQNLDKTAYHSIGITLPPLSEQQTLITYIKTQTAPIETAITQAEQEITLIREYRERLIFDAVTGQIDLRHWQPSSNDLNLETDLTTLSENDTQSTDSEEDCHDDE